MKLHVILPITLCMLLGGVNTNTTTFKTVDASSPTTTYLVLTEHGLYNGEKGDVNETLFLENVIEFNAAHGEALPNGDVITSEIDGIIFSSWVRYEGNGLPTIHTTVPKDSGAILYADWICNPDGGGSSGGGGSDTSTTMDVYFKAPSNWNTNINIYLWGSSGELAKWPGTPMEHVSDNLYKFNYDTASYPNVIFNDGTKQTSDLTSPTSEEYSCYTYGSGWGDINGSDIPEEEEIWYIVGEGSFVTGETWNPSGGVAMTVNEAYSGSGVEFFATDVAFTSGDIWKLCSSKDNWISSGWEQDAGALANGDMSLVSDNMGGNNVSVNKTGLYDIYFKVYGNNSFSCYISTAK